ncbi:MAG: hypothetical protein P1U88_18900 [Thalassobaculaceae bacterium]|nr:hypothetical protein [Thalassobaculaceae bacterium]
MLNIWKPVPAELSASILDWLEEKTGEALARDKVELTRCASQPYDSYVFMRADLGSQWVLNQRDESRKYGILEHSFSFLMAQIINGEVRNVVPLRADREDLYCFNRMVDLEVTEENLLDYLVVLGQVHRGYRDSFHFIKNLGDLGDVLALVGEEQREKVEHVLSGLYGIDNENSLKIQYETKSYPFLGKSFKINLPAVYDGDLFVSKIRVSNKGYVEMDDDERTAITQLNIVKYPEVYYRLDRPEETDLIFSQIGSQIGKAENLVVKVFLAEKVISILLFPTFAVFIVIMLALGVSDQQAQGFFDRVSEITFLNVTSMVLGVVMLLVAAARFGVLQLMRFTAKLVPNRSTLMFINFRNLMTGQRQKLGNILFFGLFLLELILLAFPAFSMFVYGTLNLFGISDVNFFESFLFVIWSLPGMSFLFADGITVGLYSVPPNTYMSWFVSFFITTVFVGFMFNILWTVRSK